tara:strand:+ start:6205 stop:7077 length:873 start_codon:yes stop_codon:yes gene_type:complete
MSRVDTQQAPTSGYEVSEIDVTGYRPAILADQPQPMMIWANIADLVVDRRYQRSITAAGRKAIQRIADNFDWRKYQPILVAPTDGGKMAIVDGQHRAHAAMLCGIEALPAMTVAMSQREQAAGFAAINRDRIKMTPPVIYRAELAAGTDWAINIKQVVEKSNCEIATYIPSQVTKKPRIIYAVNLIKKMVGNGEGEAVIAGLSAISSSVLGGNVESYNGQVLAIWLEAIATNQRFMTMDLSAAFEEIDFDTLRDTCRVKSRATGTAAKQHAVDCVVSMLRDQLKHGEIAA